MRMENNSLLFLLHLNYYIGSSTPYKYYLRFPKTNDFRKTTNFRKIIDLGNYRMTLKMTNNSKLTRETLFFNSLF